MNMDTLSPEIDQRPKDSLLVTNDPYSPYWQQGVSIEASVFIEKNYVTSEEELAGEYAKYLPASQFIVAERGGVVGGAVRAIHFVDGIGFKTLDDIQAGKLEVSEEGRTIIASMDLSRTVEIGTLAVLPELRGKHGDERRLTGALYGGIRSVGHTYDAPFCIASFDEAYYRGFRWTFGKDIIHALGPATDYMGSATVPALFNLEELYASALTKRPELGETIKSAAEATEFQIS